MVQHEVESDAAEGLLDSSLDGKLEEEILNWEPEASLIPENLTLLSTPMTSPAWPCVDSPRSLMVENDSVNRVKDSREIEMTRPEGAPPMRDPIVTQMNMPENLAPVSAPMMPLTWPCVAAITDGGIRWRQPNKRQSWN